MRYYAQYDETGALLAIGTGELSGIEITEAEYNRLLKEIRDKAAYVDAVATDPAAIETVPEEWREEIQRRADEEIQRRKEAEEAAKQLSDEELADMIEGVM